MERAHPYVAREDQRVEIEADGVRMRLDLRDYTQRRMFYFAYERNEAPSSAAFFDRVMRSSTSARTWASSTLRAAAAVGPSGEVHSFEPVPANFAALTANAALNGFENVVLNNAAAGIERTAVFGLPHRTPDRGDTSGMFTRDGEWDRIELDVVDLAAYVESRLGRDIRLIKMDV